MINFFRRITGIDKLEKYRNKLLIEVETVMINFFRRITGIDKLEKYRNKLLIEVEAAKYAKMSPKEQATVKKEPWVAVLETRVNKENVRNGFLELDWNDYFIIQLRQAGYGYEGDPDEAVVDRWFKDLARNILADEGHSSDRTAGLIDVSAVRS